MYEDFATVRRQKMARDFPARLTRHLQHNRPSVQQEINQAQRWPGIHIDRCNPVHGGAVLMFTRCSSASRRAPLQRHGVIFEAILDGLDRC